MEEAYDFTVKSSSGTTISVKPTRRSLQWPCLLELHEKYEDILDNQ